MINNQDVALLFMNYLGWKHSEFYSADFKRCQRALDEMLCNNDSFKELVYKVLGIEKKLSIPSNYYALPDGNFNG